MNREEAAKILREQLVDNNPHLPEVCQTDSNLATAYMYALPLVAQGRGTKKVHAGTFHGSRSAEQVIAFVLLAEETYQRVKEDKIWGAAHAALDLARAVGVGHREYRFLLSLAHEVPIAWNPDEHYQGSRTGLLRYALNIINEIRDHHESGSVRDCATRLEMKLRALPEDLPE